MGKKKKQKRKPPRGGRPGTVSEAQMARNRAKLGVTVSGPYPTSIPRMSPAEHFEAAAVKFVCRACRFTWMAAPPVSFVGYGGSGFNNFSVSMPCPVCGNMARSEDHVTMPGPQDSTILAPTLTMALHVLKDLRDRLAAEEISVDEVAEAVEKIGGFARFAAWMRRHQGSVGLAVGMLSAIITGAQYVQGLTAPRSVTEEDLERVVSAVIEQVEESHQADEDARDDEIEQIISGVLERLRESESTPPPPAAP